MDDLVELHGMIGKMNLDQSKREEEASFIVSVWSGDKEVKSRLCCSSWSSLSTGQVELNLIDGSNMFISGGTVIIKEKKNV